MAEPDSTIRTAREKFDRAADAEDHNRQTYLDDYKFSRLEEQWPDEVRKQRERSGRPCLTIDKTKAFIRQVVNDARQNKPSIKVRAVDSNADPETAEIINGLIRNIEYTSNADVAYDTAVECSVGGGFGYWRIGLEYAHDDAFEMDIRINRVSNPLSVYGDPYSTAADSSDWNDAFVVERMPHDKFKAAYGDKATVDWDDDAWSDAGETWRDGDYVMVAEWWHREEVEREIVQLEDGTVLDREAIDEDEDLSMLMEAGVLKIASTRTKKSFKVAQRIMSGVEVLEENEWPGKYIPIIPVYGDEFDVEGKRYLRSLIHPAIDSQRMFNYWRTTSTELVALAPRVPFIGPKGAFDTDQQRWNSINTENHAYVEYDGSQPPQRQPLDSGAAAGALQEALNASDDMKSILGIYDASLGARSNETSGRAIMARQREGDISTFHFIDNLARSIRHTGRVILDLIPKVYTEARIVRVMGEDGTDQPAAINRPEPVMGEDGQPQMDEMGNPITRIHDLTAGKYDLTVTTGPSFTTRREEAATQMTELIRAFPQAAPFIADIMARNFDWPGADEIAKRFEAMVPQGAQDGIPPQIMQQIQEGVQRIQELETENAALKEDKRIEAAKLQEEARANRAQEGIDQFEAQTGRIKAANEIAKTVSQPAPQQYPQR